MAGWTGSRTGASASRARGRALRAWLPAACGVAAGIVVAAILPCRGGTVRKVVRVGVYDNPPKIGIADNTAPCGFFIDLIEHIARREQWDITYVPGTWEAGLRRLEADSIDLMPDVALSEARRLRFDFNQLVVLSSWLQAFARTGVPIESLADLNGRKVAVLKGSIQQQACEDVRTRLGLSFELVVLPDYEAIIKAVEGGVADVLVASRFFAFRRELEGTLAPTAVLLDPTTLHFAAARGRNPGLLAAIDKHLAAMKNDPRSVYYRSLARWLSEEPRSFVPAYVVWSAVACALGLVFFVAMSVALRWQVRRRTDELHQRNRDLLAALTDLKAAQDEAIKRERLYVAGQLASGVAHDFNNLLVPIMGYADALLSDPAALDDKEDVRQALEGVRTAAAHGAEIVQRMQDFCRVTRQPRTVGRVETNAVIRDVIALARARWAGRGAAGKPRVEVALNLGDNCDIAGSRSEIHDMLVNLVLNAADAMPEGGRLEISTENTGAMVRIMVKDTGVGMTEEVREKCTQPFFTTKGAQGTGMGLTMASTTAAEHGGLLQIVSAVGVGTSVIVTLPALATTNAPAK